MHRVHPLKPSGKGILIEWRFPFPGEGNMKCYEYCQALFDEVFLPVLQEQFPEILPQLSVGVVG